MVKRDRVWNKSKRLRKKLHLGEFGVVCVDITFHHSAVGVDESCSIIDDICDFIDCCGEVAMPVTFSSDKHVTIWLEKPLISLLRDDIFHVYADVIAGIIQKHTDVTDVVIGEEHDPWEDDE